MNSFGVLSHCIRLCRTTWHRHRVGKHSSDTGSTVHQWGGGHCNHRHHRIHSHWHQRHQSIRHQPNLARRPFDQHRHRRCLRHPNRLQRCIQLHRHSLRRRHLGHRHNHHRSLRHRHAFAWHPNSHRPRWCSHHRNHRIHFNRPRHPLFLYCPSTSRRPCI